MDLPGDLSFIVHPSLVRAPANTKKCNLQCTSRQLRQDIDIFSFPRHPRGGRTCRGGTEEENRKKKRGAKSQSRIDPSRRVKCQAGSLSPICFIFGFRSNQMSNPAIRPDRAVASSGMGFSAHVAQRPCLLKFYDFQLLRPRPRLQLQLHGLLQLQLRLRLRPLHDTSHVPGGADTCHNERQWAKQPKN